MSSDNISKTIGVALGVCLVCSILVSTAAVLLKPIQKHNAKIDLLTNILVAGDLYEEGVNAQEVFETNIDAEILELSSGQFLTEDKLTDELNTEVFDIDAFANSSELGKEIPASDDLAGIKKMPKYMAVYKVKGDSGVSKYILPLYGKGLWSTMYGFIALNKDLHTIDGFTFYKHGETPGLGGEVDNPKWKAQWVGKQAFDEDWNLKITVIKSMVDATSPNAKYQIDGLSGSTLTTRGIDNTVKFWLGNNGYAPFFKNLREGK